MNLTFLSNRVLKVSCRRLNFSTATLNAVRVIIPRVVLDFVGEVTKSTNGRERRDRFSEGTTELFHQDSSYLEFGNTPQNRHGCPLFQSISQLTSDFNSSSSMIFVVCC